MKKKQKYVLMTCVLTFCVFLTPAISAKAQEGASRATTYTMDNDDSTGYKNSSSGTWDYITSSGCYRGDARSCYAGVSNFYSWGFGSSKPLMGGTCRASIKAYINYSTFKNPAAQYSVFVLTGTGSANSYSAGRLNQGSAPRGWAAVGTATWTTSSPKQVSHVQIRSTANYYTTGADGLQLTL